jgi:hypothetical protein
MDSEEIRRKRREKILMRSNEVEKTEIDLQKTEELSAREQMDLIQSIDDYKVIYI